MSTEIKSTPIIDFYVGKAHTSFTKRQDSDNMEKWRALHVCAQYIGIYGDTKLLAPVL